MQSAVRSDRKVGSGSLIFQVQAVEGLDASAHIRTMQRARRIVTDEVNDTDLQSYTRLPSLLKIFQELNDGSVTRCESTEDGSFMRALLVCGPAVRAHPSLQRILGIDGVHGKNPLYSGVQLASTARTRRELQQRPHRHCFRSM